MTWSMTMLLVEEELVVPAIVEQHHVAVAEARGAVARHHRVLAGNE